MSLEKEIVELLKGLGAVRVGFANLETLAGSPPSADLKYILPEARSAVSFALPLNREFLRRFLAKKHQLAHEDETGLHESGTWSTWSPGRFGVPEDDKELEETFRRAVGLSGSWIKTDEGGFKNEVFPGGCLRITCGVCALVCSGNKEETEENYRVLTTSGCVVQDESGTKHVLPADEAAARFESFSPEHKNLYR